MNPEIYREFCAREGQPLVAFTKVKLPYGWLGNMSPHPVQFDGKFWPTAEALFQALRLPEGHPVRELIREQKSPMGAKMIAKKHRSERCIEPMTPEDVELMRRVLETKLAQNLKSAEFARQWRILGNMGDVLIVEDSSNRQNESGLFWGAAKVDGQPGLWRGTNQLGELWMEILKGKAA